MNDLPESDRISGVAHPKDSDLLFGHSIAEAQVLEAFNSSRMQHAWMITGPKGIGKASLAYKIARFLLAQHPPDKSLFATTSPTSSLQIPQDNPVAIRIRAGSEPGLYVLKRPVEEKTSKLKTVITVGAVRQLRRFFEMSAGGNGRRVVIVDCVDDMNANAANALLKVLEEPPENALLLLVTHQPSLILPTIKSRCRKLACHPLSPKDMQAAFEQILPDHYFDPSLVALANGSVGQATELILKNGLETYAEIIALLQTLPKLDRTKLLKLANSVGNNGEGKFDQLLDLFNIFLARLARSSVATKSEYQAALGEREVFAKLCPDQTAANHWANIQLELGQQARQGKTANLDPSSLILDMCLKIEDSAAQAPR